MIWLLIAVLGVVLKYFSGPEAYNNYLIYKGTFTHFTQQVSLYGRCPELYGDMNHYGVLFALIIAPFALMPDLLGLLAWMVGGVYLLYYAVRMLPVGRIAQTVIMLLATNELFLAVAHQQFNITTASLIILTFVAINRRAEGWAAVMILMGFFVKIYGIVGLAFFFFVKRKWRFVLWLAGGAVVLFILPMVFSSPDYVLSQWSEWIRDIPSKNQTNMFAYHQNISLLGVIRKISGSDTYSDVWIMGPALVIFAGVYLRIKQYKHLDFQLLLLSSVLLFIPLMSSGSESCSYIMAMLGVGIWLAARDQQQQQSLGWARWTLVGLVLLASFASNLLPREIYTNYFYTYSLKAVPFALVWLRVCWELYFRDFTNLKKHNEAASINRRPGI